MMELQCPDKLLLLPFFLVLRKKEEEKTKKIYMIPMHTELHFEWKSIDVHVKCAEYMRLLFVKIKCPRAI